MTRYFYPATRAHHAFCMATDFGMKFEKRDGLWTPEGILSVTGAGGYRLVVAGESLPLLVPQIGDRIIWRNPKAVIREWQWRVMDERSVHPDNEYRIVERDGKPFVWPESGE